MASTNIQFPLKESRYAAARFTAEGKSQALFSPGRIPPRESGSGLLDDVLSFRKKFVIKVAPENPVLCLPAGRQGRGRKVRLQIAEEKQTRC